MDRLYETLMARRKVKSVGDKLNDIAPTEVLSILEHIPPELEDVLFLMHDYVQRVCPMIHLR